jgi:outer membrane protein assembly factor BamA
LNLGEGSVAYVFDNALLGATSPVIGQRYRIDASPMIGSIRLVQALADYRRYFLPVRPFTLALRVLHYGRYGRDAQDTRLTPLFLGYEDLVRGYGYRSFDPSECRPPASDPNACPVFDQLLGSRILVGNFELRFPLFGLLGIGHGYYGAFPIELAAFGDAGVAWNQGESPTLFGGSRPGVASAGLAARINLFGFAVAQVDWVHPFDRPQRNWLWQFTLQPGF